MLQFIRLPRPSRSALDDSLILLRLAVLYGGLGLLSHYVAAWVMRFIGSQFHIDTQFLMLDALFAASVMLGSLFIAWLLQPDSPLRWLFGSHLSVRGVLLAILGAVVMVYAADPLAGWFDLRLPDSVLLPEDEARPQAVTPLLELTGGRWLAALVIAVLWVPAAEEFIFRGWLFKALARTRPGMLIALPASTLIFALLHGFYSPGGVLVIGVLGTFLGWLRWRYDQLWLCVLAHAVYNGLTLFMVSIQ